MVGQHFLLRAAARTVPAKKYYPHIVSFMFQRLYRQSRGSSFELPLNFVLSAFCVVVGVKKINCLDK